MKKQTEDIFEPAIPVVPQGWDVLPFEQAIDVISDKSKRVKQSAYLSSGKLAVIGQGQDFVGGYTDDENMAFEGELPVILFGDHTRSIKYVDKSFAVGAEGVKILKPSGGFDPKYLYYLLRSLHIPSRGYSRHFQFLRKSHFPRAPEKQQKRIVAEIEKQFSRLDKAVANLKRVKINLKRYKAAVLKDAVEGRLVETEAELARREGRDYETGAQLLQRILTERRRRWEKTELAKIKKKDKIPKDDKWKKKYKEPVASDTANLPELPEGWVWATVEQLSGLVEYGSSAKTNLDSTGIPVLRMGNIVEGDLSFDDLKYLPCEHDEFPKLLLKPGDLLFNRTNSPELVGKTAVFGGSPKLCSFASYLIRVRLVQGGTPDFLAASINSSHGRNWVKSVVTQQVGQANVNGTKLQALNVPRPPEPEQQRIVAEIDRRLSLVRKVETQVDGNIKRAEHLRQSILKTVFSAKLVVCRE